MPDRPQTSEALHLLRRELDEATLAGPSLLTELNTQEAWLGFLRFGRRRFDTAVTPESDGLLFQYGTYAFGGPPVFTLDLTRQFDIEDADGEHDHYTQIHCELVYAPDPVLDHLGSFNSWFFHDTDKDLDRWAEALSDRLDPLRGRTPADVRLYEGPV
ncbi:hypothetical protein ABT040_33575 [Streptomyces sp. NPDC002688]|uniref:hypothetical protein n=1 Tax=Streptomyces sp. NPDC002688 TaxID=3154423 RepID=UPI0033180F0B